MRVFAISDLHLDHSGEKPMDVFSSAWEGQMDKIWASCKEFNITDDDILILGGDTSWAMKLESAAADLKIAAEFPGKKIVIKGNHDYWWQSISKVRSALPQGMYAIQNDAIRFGNIIFCGTRGWMLPEHGKALSAENQKILDRELIRMELTLQQAKKLQKEQEDMIIALIHYPPFNRAGEESSFTTLFKKYGVAKVVYGHLHGKNVKGGFYNQIDGIEYYLTSCDLCENKITQIL